MDQSQSAPLLGGRYELMGEGENGTIEVLDREPWRFCWSCSSTDNEAGENFCTRCGADLRNRRYQGFRSSNKRGPALIALIHDDAARDLLPQVWDELEDGNETFVLLKPNDASPSALPLDELVALRVGLALAHMLAALHRQNLELGALVPSDLGLTAAGQPQILNLDNLCHIDEDEHQASVQGDLQSLAGLLEALTNTPRMTQRLSDDSRSVDTGLPDKERDLSMVLREIRTNEIQHAERLAERFEELLSDLTRPLSLHQVVGSHTDTGVVRDHNEDSLLALKLNMNNTSTEYVWGLYIVADGMGGHAGGEVASGLAIRSAASLILSEYLANSLNPDRNYDERWIKDVVHRAVLEANETVRLEGQTRHNDMGTTMTIALVVGDRATFANVGDSRAYLYRDGKLERITRDHSLVMRLVELGQIRDEDIYTHPQRNAVLRSLGDRQSIDVDLFTRRLRSGDALLLCSDGQWEMTHDAEMETLLATYDDPDTVCQELIKAANKAGGEDNVTSVFVRFL